MYKNARRKVFGLIQQQIKRPFHIRFLWSFGDADLVRPLMNMGRLIMSEIESPDEQLWCYSTWKTMVGIQMDKASDLAENFRGSVKV